MITHIRKSRTHGYWNLTMTAPISFSNWFMSYEGAVNKAKQMWKKYRMECGSYSMLLNIKMINLTVLEFDFINKLKQKKCCNITQAQYGYLKGIYERQQSN